jgi:hypothetical protein
MAYEKIATCCYCGTKAALVLRGHTQHELACSSFGAPLSVMKHLKSAQAPEMHHYSKMPKVKKPKKKKSSNKKLFKMAFDVLDDIFD